MLTYIIYEIWKVESWSALANGDNYQSICYERDDKTGNKIIFESGEWEVQE